MGKRLPEGQGDSELDRIMQEKQLRISGKNMVEENTVVPDMVYPEPIKYIEPEPISALAENKVEKSIKKLVKSKKFKKTSKRR